MKTPRIIGHEDSQIILYAKGHFAKGDTINDLRSLVAKRAMMLPVHISDIDIIQVLCIVVEECGANENVRLADTLLTILYGSRWGRPFAGDTRSPHERCVDVLLGMLRETQVRDDETVLLHLSEADAAYLPLSKDASGRTANAVAASMGGTLEELGACGESTRTPGL